MNIKRITIQNFRNIGIEKTFYLNPDFTAFIGVNGKGKSIILHALRTASGSYFLAIPDVKSHHIQKDEIRIIESGKLLLQQFPVKIETEGSFPDFDNTITWRRQWLEGSSSTTSTNADVGAIRSIALEKYNRVQKQSDDKVDLPVIAFFGITRAVGAGRVTRKSRIQRLGRQLFKEGYQDWEEMKAVKFHYEEWLGTYAVSSASPHDSQELETLIDKDDAGQILYGDSAYIGQEESIEWCGMTSQIDEKGFKDHPLTDEQNASNRQKSKTRALVEHVFGFMTNSMDAMHVRTIGLYRAAEKSA